MLGLLSDLLIVIIIVGSVLLYAKRGIIGVSIDIAGFIFSALVSWYCAPSVGKHISGLIKKLIDTDGEDLASGVLSSGVVSRILGFLAVFITVTVIVKLIARLTRDIKLPIISRVDKLLGAILGLVLGLAWAYIISMSVVSVISLFALIIPNFPTEMFDTMIITDWFYRFNIFKMIFATV